MNLHLISSNDIEENLICFYSELVIYLHENVITAFNRPVVYMQSICDFNKKNVSDTVGNIVNKYNLDRFITFKHKQNESHRRRKSKRKK